MSNAPQLPETDSLALTNAELARELKISSRHLFTLERTGRIGPKAIRLGHAVRWPRSEIEAWLAAGAPSREQWERQKAS